MHRWPALFFFLCVSLFPALASSPTCDELNHLWRTRFHSDFKVRWVLEPFTCPSHTAKVAKSFYDVLTPRFSVDYYTFAKTLIRGTTYELKECDSYAYMSGGVMTLCRKFFDSDDEGRAGTIIHEAAHGRLEDTGHVVCRRGKSVGKQSCDEIFSEAFKGSGYNFEFMYYSQLLSITDYPNLDPKIVRGYIENSVLNHFNVVSPMQLRKWISRWMFDGTRWVPEPETVSYEERCSTAPRR